MIILIALGALAAIIVLIADAVVRYAVRKHGLGMLAFRWLTGHHLDGVIRTDAGWLRPGIRALTQTGHASRWAHRPRLVRAAVRSGVTLIVVGALFGVVVDAAATVLALELLGAAGLALGVWRAVVGVLNWQHRRRWVKPLHRALAPVIGHPLALRPGEWIDVPRDYAGREGAEVILRLPEGFAPTGEITQRAITDIVAAKLALEAPVPAWRLHGKTPQVTYRVQTPPPDLVSYADVREAIAAAKDTAPVLGLGRGRKPVGCDLANDSPHILLSMGSGAGKSVAARVLTAQVLNRGGLALVLDVKRLSHAWARGLPNVRYARDAAEIHDALLWLAAELDSRNRAADEGSDIDGNTDGVDIGPRILVVCEELNATAQRLAAYWRSVKGNGDPNTSPALEALGEASFMGRATKINLVLIAQMLTARAVGGPEVRESAGTRLLGRYTVNNARMLVPEIYPFPKSSRRPGRIQAYVGGELHETQLTLMTPAEARELATSGVVSPFPRASGAEGGREPLYPSAIRLRPADEPIGLRQAVADGVIPIGLEAVRKARTRDPEFPAPRGEGRGGEQLFDRGELALWARNRPRAAGES